VYLSNVTLLFYFIFNNSVKKKQPTLIIFSTQHPEETLDWKVINLPKNSPTNCCCTALAWKCNSYVMVQQDSTAISMKQLVYKNAKHFGNSRRLKTMKNVSD